MLFRSIKEGVKSTAEQSYSTVMGEYLCEMKKRNPSICAVTAAMEKGTGLSVYKDKYSESFYDVGIAEECAVTFAGGLAIGGMLPVCALYSTFMQRTFDQLLEDISLQNTHVIMAIDRAGLVPGDGVTHQGVFDVAMLSSIPGATVYSPESYSEMKYSFDCAEKENGLCAIRYPKGTESNYDRSIFKAVDRDKTIFATDCDDADVAIITYGRITANVLKAAELSGKKVKIIRLLKVNPIDHNTVLSLCNNAKILIVEEGIRRGGVGEAIAAAAGQADYKNTVAIHALESGFVPHGDLESIMDMCGFTAEKIADVIDNL